MTFSSLGLSEPLLCAVKEQGYDKPTPIQMQGIPAVLKGNDIMAAAQTGTGKTASFTLPLLHRLSQGRKAGANQARALVLTPTRELAAQVESSITTYGKYLPLTSTVVFGGVKINPQMIRLRKGVDILVATPGRLLDLYQKNAVKFDHLEVLVLDEADRMLDMGFIHDIRKVIGLLPKNKQTLLFSATFSDEIKKLSNGLLRSPALIEVARKNTTADSVTQIVHPVDKNLKRKLLSYLIGSNNWKQVLVFARTKHGSDRLAKQLITDGIKASAIHGNKSQGARTRALADFKAGKVRVLVATDIAARGLDIEQLPHVVNFDLPNIAEDYVHRIGRTGRAGNEGEAMSLVCVDELGLLKDIERLIKREIPREEIDGFEVDPTIKPEPIKGRGRQQQGGGKRNGKKPGNKNKGKKKSSGKSPSSSPWNKRTSSNKRSNTQNRTRHR